MTNATYDAGTVGQRNGWCAAWRGCVCLMCVRVPDLELVAGDVEREEAADPADGLRQEAQLPIGEVHPLQRPPFLRLLEHPHHLLVHLPGSLLLLALLPPVTAATLLDVPAVHRHPVHALQLLLRLPQHGAVRLVLLLQPHHLPARLQLLFLLLRGRARIVPGGGGEEQRAGGVDLLVVGARGQDADRVARGGDVGDGPRHGGEHGRVAQARHAPHQVDLRGARRRARGRLLEVPLARGGRRQRRGPRRPHRGQRGEAGQHVGEDRVRLRRRIHGGGGDDGDRGIAARFVRSSRVSVGGIGWRPERERNGGRREEDEGFGSAKNGNNLCELATIVRVLRARLVVSKDS